MADDYTALKQWQTEAIEEFGVCGKHTKMYSAPFAHGYQWRGPDLMDRRPRTGAVYSMWDRVSRAIPVEGTVTEPGPSWEKSPQVRFWMEERKPSLGARIRGWLRRGAA